MSVRSSSIASLMDFGQDTVLHERGLVENAGTHSEGVEVPRKGSADWSSSGDYAWEAQISYATTGEELHIIEIWAGDSSTEHGARVVATPLPPAASGETRLLISEASLRVVPYDERLFLSAKIVVGSGGSVDAGVSLRRAT